MTFKNQKVLVTGGDGMIGSPLVRMLRDRGAIVSIADIKSGCDLTHLDACLTACDGMDYVFHLAGVKGSPRTTMLRPADFFVPMLLFNTGILEAARRCRVKWTLYTSTVGVYPPADIFYEDDLWKGNPSSNDWFAGWAKRMGELQVDAYRIQYGLENISIVRPANVYGPGDRFDPETCMVLPALIRRAVMRENPFVVWGDGSAVRDFVYADDVARGMIMAVEKGITQPLNLGSGIPVTIKEVTECVLDNCAIRPELIWDETKPKGDAVRLFNIDRARSFGYSPVVSLRDGIKKTMDWYATACQEKGVTGQYD